MSELPQVIIDQSFFNNKELDLNGWFLLNQRSLRINEEEVFSDGKKVYVFLTDGILHKTDGPDVVCEEDGMGYLIKYYQNNLLYNPNGPSILRVDIPWTFDGNNFLISPDAKFTLEHYTNPYGFPHRVDGPAKVSKLREKNEYEYYYEGVKHLKRDFVKLPAVMDYNNKKKIKGKMTDLFGDNQ